MVGEQIQNYVNLVGGLTRATKAKASEAAQGLLSATGLDDVAADAGERVSNLAEEIMAASRANRELLLKMIDAEVDKAAGRLGFARVEDLETVRGEVAELRAALTEQSARAETAEAAATEATAVAAAAAVAAEEAATSAEEAAVSAEEAAAAPTPATSTAPATKSAPRAKKAVAAKKAPAKKAPAKKAPAKKSTARATTPTTKAPARRKAAAGKAPATKAPATKAPATKAPATKAPARKAPAPQPPAKQAASATKPAAPRKAPASALVVKAGEEKWTKAELRQVLDELHEQRAHTVAAIEAQTSELSGLMRNPGDGAGQDQADMGATSFERDHELTVLNSERDKLAQIDRALARIDDGTYGVCESCGEPIGKMRLMAFPRATLCMTCKQREERR